MSERSEVTPIFELETIPEPPEGFGAWSEYTDPGGRWLPKAAKAGAFTATTVASGFLFAFALGAVPGLDMISFDAVTPATALIAGLVVLVSLVGVHEGLHGVVGYFIGADVSFTFGRYGSFRTLSRHTIQGRRETMAFYLAPLVIGTPLWFGVLLGAGANHRYVLRIGIRERIVADEHPRTGIRSASERINCPYHIPTLVFHSSSLCSS